MEFLPFSSDRSPPGASALGCPAHLGFSEHKSDAPPCLLKHGRPLHWLVLNLFPRQSAGCSAKTLSNWRRGCQLPSETLEKSKDRKAVSPSPRQRCQCDMLDNVSAQLRNVYARGDSLPYSKVAGSHWCDACLHAGALSVI